MGHQQQPLFRGLFFCVNARRYYDNGGKLYGFYYDGTEDDGFYYYKRNIQGDIMGIIDSAGWDVVSYSYDAWRKLLGTTGSKASTVGADNPFRYRGYYYDDETGLYYLNQRYYNPEWGRFINADDVLGQPGQLLRHNVFAYCGNNPINMVDTSGREAAVMQFVQQTPWLAILWGVALVEPTPAGEVAAFLVTLGAYVIITVGENIRAANETSIVNSIDLGDLTDEAKHHTLEGTNGRHIEGWKRFNIDPQKPRAWDKLLPFLKAVLEEWDKHTTQVAPNGGALHFFTKFFEQGGIEVKLWESVEGVMHWSNAYPLN